MPGRSYTSSSSSYRYGFNGKEKDNEVKGDGNQYDYGFRIYDPRVVRFLSVDPLTKSYPELTPYQFASNSPIANIDLDGGEAKYYVINLNDDKPVLKHYKDVDIKWLPNFLEPDVISVEAVGLNTTYTFTGHSFQGNYIGDFEAFKKDPIASIYSGNYVTDAQMMEGAVRDLAFALLAGRAAMMEGVGSSKGMKGAKFAQKKINSNKLFSPEGQAKYSKLAGSEIKSVGDLASAIKNKKVKVEDVAVDYVMRGEEKVILNTRTSAALKQAGIPMEKWVGSDKTGVKVPGMDGKTFDDLANEQIKRNYKSGEPLATEAPE